MANFRGDDVLPEEEELGRLESIQKELRDSVTLSELDLETIKVETGKFQRRYYKAVGGLYAKLDELDAKIAKTRLDRAPNDPAAMALARSAEQRARNSAEEAGLAKPQSESPPFIGPELKQAYRQAVKLMHPDLALSDHEQKRRTTLMASLNRAYESGDLREIERIVAEFGQDPEAIVGEDIASRIVKAIRRIAQLRRRLVELERELEAHRQADVFELRQTIEAAEASGEDPLGILARQLKAEISRREAELEAIRAASPS
jgi:hypothetical protein